MAFADDLRRFGPGCSARVSRDEALAYCARLTATHYENFSVVTRLTPREHRPAFQSIYAFCRWSDDLGDEVGDPRRSLELLDWWRGELRAMYQGQARHPVMIALGETVERYGIPIEPFEALISAFEQDQSVTEYLTYRAIARLLHAVGQPGGPAGPVRRRGVQPGECPALRRHLHGTPTGQLLAGRGARPGDRADLPAPRGSGSIRLSGVRPAGAAVHAGVRRADEVRGRADPRACSPRGGPWCRGCRGRWPSTSTCSRAAAWRSSTGSRPGVRRLERPADAEPMDQAPAARARGRGDDDGPAARRVLRPGVEVGRGYTRDHAHVDALGEFPVNDGPGAPRRVIASAARCRGARRGTSTMRSCSCPAIAAAVDVCTVRVHAAHRRPGRRARHRRGESSGTRHLAAGARRRAGRPLRRSLAGAPRPGRHRGAARASPRSCSTRSSRGSRWTSSRAASRPSTTWPIIATTSPRSSACVACTSGAIVRKGARPSGWPSIAASRSN